MKTAQLTRRKQPFPNSGIGAKGSFGTLAQLAAQSPKALALLQLKAEKPQEAVNQTGLPGPLKCGIEALSGYTLDAVRVHANSGQPAKIGALAFAQGTEIHLAPGQEKHLPHEAWHVVQQAQGRVAQTVQRGGVAINDDPALEAEADVMGARALALGASTR
jgi:hypothetical protein